MGKRTKKVGVTGKYGTRYGSSVRKQIRQFEVSQRQKYNCAFCGKKSVKRTAVGIWQCRGCSRSVAGGAWAPATTAATTAKTTLKRLREYVGL